MSMAEQYMTVKMAKESGVIPPDYFDIFSDNCRCGQERMIRINKDEDITMMTCIDAHCRYKVQGQLEKIFKAYEIKGIAGMTISKFLDSIHPEQRTIAAILTMDNIEEKNIREAIEHIRTTKITLEEFLVNLNYPFITEAHLTSLAEDFEANMEMINSNYNDFKEKYNYFNNTYALYNLYLYRLHIDHIYKYYKTKKIFIQQKMSLYICITGKPDINNKPVTKKVYVSYLNKLVEDTCRSLEIDVPIEIIDVDSVSKASAVITSELSYRNRTTKIDRALEIEMSMPEGQKFIFRPTEYINEIIEQLNRFKE